MYIDALGRPDEPWHMFGRRTTKHLKEVRKGTRLRNIVSKEKAVATERITRSHPYVQVRLTQKRGKHKGKKRRTAWFAPHVRIVKH
jgi:hypothetical protein